MATRRPVNRPWRAWYYGYDENGEIVGKVFERPEDVPAGWQTSAAKLNPSLNDPVLPDPPQSGAVVDRKQIIAELQALGVKVNLRAATRVLADQLAEVLASAPNDDGK